MTLAHEARTSRGRRAHRTPLALALALLAAIGTTAAAPSMPRVCAAEKQQKSDEETVKAAFVFNFAARHVKWPDSAHRDKQSPFVIGVLGRDAFLTRLEETCRGRKIGERSLVVRVVESTADALSCHMLAVTSAREGDVQEYANAAKGKPLLIVGNSEAAIARGAHIAFFVEKSKVRFAIAPERAKGSQLEISSELLKLARIVDKDAREGQ